MRNENGKRKLDNLVRRDSGRVIEGTRAEREKEIT